MLTDYLSRGFDRPRVDVAEKPEPADASKIDIEFHITEGQQIFVRNVLLTGLHYTRLDTVAKAITLHPGDPLNETALADTQRNLYEFALFNEVNTAVENPNGGKDLQDRPGPGRRSAPMGSHLRLRPRTQTGNRRRTTARASEPPAFRAIPTARPAISPRGLADLTRNNLFGREPVGVNSRHLRPARAEKSTCSTRILTSRAIATSGSISQAAMPTARNVTPPYVASRLESGDSLD